MYLITCNSIACFTSLWTSESISTCTFVFYSRGYPATVPIPKCQILKTKQHTTSQFCLYLLIFITFITHLHKRLVDITEDSGPATSSAKCTHTRKSTTDSSVASTHERWPRRVRGVWGRRDNDGARVGCDHGWRTAGGLTGRCRALCSPARRWQRPPWF